MKSSLNIFLLFIMLLSCEKNNFELSTHADEFFFLRNEGADLPVWVQGNTASKVFIVYLHGGPSNDGSMSDWGLLNSRLMASLTEDYAMVLYDQRATGSSQGNFDSDLLTEEQFVDDLDMLLILLRNKYGTDIDLYLFGVSWGGYLGNAYLCTSNNQDKVRGWISDCGSHNLLLNVNAGKAMTMDYAKQQIALDANTEEWQEMLDWFQSKDTIIELMDFAQAYTYLDRAGYLMFDSTVSDLSWARRARNQNLFFSPYSASSQFSSSKFHFFVAQNYEQLNLTERMPHITTPCLFIRGKYDFGVNQRVVDEVYSLVSSEIKYKVTFNQSGHGAWSFETDAYLERFTGFIKEVNR